MHKVYAPRKRTSKLRTTSLKFGQLCISQFQLRPSPPPGTTPGIGKFSFFSCKCPGVGPKKRNNAPPLGRKTKQMPHPRANKLVNFKECTKLITCVLTICIYTSANCSFGNLQKKNQGKLSCSFQMKTSTKGCDTLAFIAGSFSL